MVKKGRKEKLLPSYKVIILGTSLRVKAVRISLYSELKTSRRHFLFYLSRFFIAITHTIYWWDILSLGTRGKPTEWTRRATLALW